MKVSIIGGAGLIGSTAAFVLAQKNIVEEICLIDIRDNIAKSHEMDMGQAVAFATGTRITSGGWEKLEGSDIVIIAVGKTETSKSVASRMERLTESMKIITSIAEHIRHYAPHALFINATNPLDVVNSVLHPLLGCSKDKIIGFSLNDTLRFRWALAEILQTNIHDIQAMVLGEHGELQIPICSRIFVNGEKIELTSEQQTEVLAKIHHFFSEYAALESGRTSGWLSSMGLTYLVEAIIENTGEVLPCSVIDDEGISIGMPVQLNQSGIEKVVSIDMTEEEKQQLEEARDKIKGIVKQVQHP